MGSGAWTLLVVLSMRIRAATSTDIDAVVAIERLSFVDPWSRMMFHTHLDGGVNTFLVAEGAAGVTGFTIAYTVADEAELLNLAVHPDARGLGLGMILLDAIMTRCAAQGGRMMVLDVRESNTIARALYARRGFTQVGRRRRYYHEPEEDALVLQAVLSVPAGDPPISR